MSVRPHGRPWPVRTAGPKTERQAARCPAPGRSNAGGERPASTAMGVEAEHLPLAFRRVAEYRKIPDLSGMPLVKPRARPPESIDAWGLTVRAQVLLGRLEQRSNHEAQGLAREAMSIDPSYARAHAVAPEMKEPGFAPGSRSVWPTSPRPASSGLLRLDGSHNPTATPLDDVIPASDPHDLTVGMAGPATHEKPGHEDRALRRSSNAS